MKKFLAFSLQLSAIFLIILYCGRVAQAAPVGSPASLLEKGQWDFALEGGGYISRRPMKSSGSGDYEVSIGQGYHSRSYGLTERLTITGRIGGTYGYIYDKSVSSTEQKTSLSSGLGLGIQLKGIIFENKDKGFEWDGSGQFLYMRSHHKRDGKANADWYEWQISTCLAKEIGRFKPYAGVKFSTVNLDHDDGQGNKTSYNEDGSVGPFVGTDIYFGRDKDVVVYLESAFLIGTESYLGIRYRF